MLVIITYHKYFILSTNQNVNTGKSPLDRARKEDHHEVVRILRAAAKGFLFSIIRVRSKRDKIILRINGCSCR